MQLQLIDRIEDAEAIAPAWEALARAGGDGALFRGPGWILPWLRAYAGVLDAQLLLLCAHDDGRLVGLAPLYERTARMGPGLRCHEVRLCGDAGPRPPALDLLVEKGFEERFAVALVEWFTAPTARHWDVIDLQPLRDP